MYTPVIEIIKKGQIDRVELKTEPTLKEAIESRELYIKQNVNVNHFFADFDRRWRS